MSLVKLAPGSAAYYAEEVASGREDYYARAAERPGVLIGRGAAALGIVGREVTSEMLERLIGEGRHPVDGSALGRPWASDNGRVVAGFGLTFSPPKTVSLLWGTGSVEVADKVLDAHDRAVATALTFLEEHAAFTRTGKGGVLQVDTDGYLAASFTHRTSRAADPQLHTHVLVANKVRAADGKWRSLDARELYEHQKAAGMLYKAALRAEMSHSLGVEWTAVDENGVAEVEGVPQVLVEAWSSRRRAVEEMGGQLVADREADLGRELTPSERATAYQLAAYRTRAPKVEADTPTSELQERWRAEATAWGQVPEQWLPNVLDRVVREPELDAVHIVKETVRRLEHSHATWGSSDAVEVITTLVGNGLRGEELRRTVDTLTDAVLGDGDVCSLAAPLPAEPPSEMRRRDGMSEFERHGATRFTTRGTLLAEGRVLGIVGDGINVGAAVVPMPLVTEVLDRSTLGADQRRAVTDLLTSGDRVSLLVGPAGAGKSRVLDTAREGFERAGFTVFGGAPSAMAAAVLSQEAGIRSETLARMLLDLGNGTRTFGPRDVVVLDEATMARTDDLDYLLGVIDRAGAKAILVGDPQQLGAVGPGGIFRTLVGDHGASELETVRRFNDPWEGQATLRLRARDISVLAEYADRGRIEGGSRPDVLASAFEAWRTARDAGKSVIVTAGDNGTADEFARRAREDRVARGEVEAGGARLAKAVAGIGDEIVTLRNDRRLVPRPDDFVRNGDRWHVVGRGADGSLDVQSMSGNGEVCLPGEYVRHHVALAYAMTVHKSQGQTVDRSIALVDEGMTAQQFYVAMSRGREENRAYVLRSSNELAEHGSVSFTQQTPIEILADVTRRDGAERSAHEVLRENLERADDLGLLRHLLAEAERQIEEKAGPDRSSEIAHLEPHANIKEARTALDAAHKAVAYATSRRESAESRVTAVESNRHGRAHLPGALGGEPRRTSDDAAAKAAAALRDARRGEQRALRDAERARAELTNTERAAAALMELRDSQHVRMSWLRDHPETEQWRIQLVARVAGVEAAIDRATREQQRASEDAARPVLQQRRVTFSRRPLGERTTVAERDRELAARLGGGAQAEVDRRLAAAREQPERPEWKSAAELEARGRETEAVLASNLAALEWRMRNDDPARHAGEAATDGAAIAHAREFAAWHRTKAERTVSTIAEIANEAAADFVAAERDQAIIEQGRGLLGVRGGALRAAEARIDATRERWGVERLPGSGWSENAVRGAATDAARRLVQPEIDMHRDAAGASESRAATIEERMTDRERSYDRRQRTIDLDRGRKQEYLDRAEVDRDALAADWRERAELTAAMSEEQIAELDAARDDYLAFEREVWSEVAEQEQTTGLEHAPELAVQIDPMVIDFGP